MMSDELKQVDVRLKLVEGNGVYSDKPITNPEEAISVMADVMAGLDREEVCVINLDSKGHPINFNVVSIGTLNSSFVSGRELFKSAILSNAASMILLHNHPSSELQMSQSDRMVTEKMMYASLFLDIEILDHIIVAGRTGDTLSIRETYPEIFDKSTYANAIVRVADGVEERENSYDTERLATYELFQIKEGGNGQAYQFMGMDFVKNNKLVVDKNDYESVYRGELKEGETLDTLYEKFNLYHPDDFTGHSMSVSDVIIMNRGGRLTAYYVDSFGFTELPDFVAQRAEMLNDNPVKAYPEVYMGTLEKAMQERNVDAYLDSRKLNIDCKNAIEQAIAEGFDGMRLNPDVAVGVIEKYGEERVAFVLANTLKQLSYDGRFSDGNKRWADGIDIPENISRGMDLNRDYIVGSHPAVLNGFIDMARKEIRTRKLEEVLGVKNQHITETTRGYEADGHTGTWYAI